MPGNRPKNRHSCTGKDAKQQKECYILHINFLHKRIGDIVDVTPRYIRYICRYIFSVAIIDCNYIYCAIQLHVTSYFPALPFTYTDRPTVCSWLIVAQDNWHAHVVCSIITIEIYEYYCTVVVKVLHIGKLHRNITK